MGSGCERCGALGRQRVLVAAGLIYDGGDMSKPSKVEVTLASVGILLLGLIGYWAVSRPAKPPAELLYMPESDGRPNRRLGDTTAPARPGVPTAALGEDAAQIQGQVRDLITGEGVPGVTVAFVPVGMSTEIAAESDARGQYELGLASGRYRVRAVGEDVVALDAAAITEPTEPGDSSARTLGGDDAATREIAVAPRSRVQGFDVYVVRLARVHGRVVDGSGQPLGEVLVRHRTSLLDRAIDSSHTAPTGEATSAAGGAFSILVPPGEVTLLGSAPGRTPSSTRIHWVAPGAELRGVEIVMDQGAELAGRVVDAAGQPVAGARVRARSDDAERAEPALDTMADQAGAFRLEALPPGRLVLQAEAAGHAPSASVVVTVSDEPGAARQDVVLRLAAPATLRGRVVDERGAGIAGAVVRALRPMSEVALPRATTDAQGGFTLELGPGPVYLAAEAPGFAPSRQLGMEVPGPEPIIMLARGGTITGVVTGRGEPLGHFTVHVMRHAASGSNVIDSWTHGMRVVSLDGSYRMADLVPGRYSVTASAPGLAPVEQGDVLVESDRETRVDLALAPGASLAGTVRDARSRAPVAGAAVRLSTGSDTAMTYTGDAGQFTISDIAPGRRSLEVRHPSYVGRIQSGIELAVGAPRRVEVALEPVGMGADQAIEMAGIGAVLVMQDQRLMVQDLVPHGPAAVSGIEPGEEVFSIDGESTRGRSFGDNVESIRGVAGTVARLGLRLGERERFLDVVRGNVRFTPD
jgi:hypothetical protein